MNIVSYKCPKCGAELLFNPETQSFNCEYCLNTFTQEDLDKYYDEYNERLNEEAAKEQKKQQAQQEFDENTVFYSCPSCGAQVITDDHTVASICYYCHSPVVLSGRLSGYLKPDKIIPFLLSREKAIESFKNLCKNKKYLPKDFYSEEQIEKLQGIYFPYWFVDKSMYAKILYRGEKVRTWRSGNRRYTERKIYDLYRQGAVGFDNYPKVATHNHDRNMLKYMHPYDESKLVDFSLPYLSGFFAEKRTFERKALQQAVDNELNNYADMLMKTSASQYTSVNAKSKEIKEISQKWEYALLPVWILTYKYKEETYVYALNGQTGKLYGKLPIRKDKLLTEIAVICSIISAIIILGWWLLF